MADSNMTSALAPGVALTSAVIYWANLQGRLDTISGRVRTLNTELRNGVAGSHRALSIARQVQMMSARSRVLHAGVVMSVVTLVAFLGSSAVVFVTSVGYSAPGAFATTLFMIGLASFGLSLMTTLWEMLWARRSLDEDIAGSRPPKS
jgi:Protein of unknown function (DUF2721)